MEEINAPNQDLGNAITNANHAQLDFYNQHIDLISHKVNSLEQKVNEIEQFYLELSKKKQNVFKGSSTSKERDKGRRAPSLKMLHQDAASREVSATKRMRDLIRQFGSIFRQITTHKWAWPFMNPVDVEGLGLHDYYEVIEKPMDFSTIKNRMEAKDSTGYNNVREICDDVRLVFRNAMSYNDERHEVHVMARKLLEKFEEKWLQFLPKVTEEEKRLEEEEAEAQLNLQLAQEAVHLKMARDIGNELHEVDIQLDGFREVVIQKCRKMSAEQKRKLSVDLTRLGHEDLSKALEIIARNNPNFQLTSEEVVIDIDAQSESTLWRLKVLVKDAFKGKKNSDKSGKNTIARNNSANNDKNKRKRELCDATAKTGKMKTKHSSS